MANETTLAELTETPETAEQETQEEATADATGEETTDEQQTTDEQGGEKKKLGGYQRKLLRLTHEQEMLAQERDYWKNQALKGGGGEQKPEPKKPEGKPRSDDFDTQADYVEALTDWKVGERLKAEDEKREQSRLRTQQEQEQVTFRERVDETRKKYDDFDDVMDAADFPRSALMDQVILTAKQGPELAYWLAKHPQKAAKIAQESFVAAGLELGRIIAEEITAKSKPGPKSPTKKQGVTQATTEPIQPVSSKGGTAGGFREGMGLSEYRRAREAGQIR